MSVITHLLNLVRPKKAPPPPPAPCPALKPPLPAKLMAELVGLDAMRNRRLDDRRRRPRLDRTGSTSILCPLDGRQQTLDANVRDMSAEGMSIEVGVALPAGTRFETNLTGLNGDRFVTLTCDVRRCEAQADGRFLIGGALLAYRLEPLI